MSESNWNLLGSLVAIVAGTLALVFNRQYTDAIVRQNAQLYPKWFQSPRWVVRSGIVIISLGVVVLGLVGLLGQLDARLPEFRGPAALIVMGLSGIVVVGGGGLTMWWLSRKPETAPALRPLRRWLIASVALALVSMVGLAVMGIVWALSD